MTEETWVYFKTFGLPLSIFSFFIFQGGVFKHHSTAEPAEDQNADQE
jgi:intracellular septation protein